MNTACSVLFVVLTYFFRVRVDSFYEVFTDFSWFFILTRGNTKCVICWVYAKKLFGFSLSQFRAPLWFGG